MASRLIHTVDRILAGIEFLGELAKRLRGESPEKVKGLPDHNQASIDRQIDSATSYKVCPGCAVSVGQMHKTDCGFEKRGGYWMGGPRYIESMMPGGYVHIGTKVPIDFTVGECPACHSTDRTHRVWCKHYTGE